MLMATPSTLLQTCWIPADGLNSAGRLCSPRMRPGEQLPIPEEAVDEGFDPGDFSGPLEWYWHFSQRGDFQTDSDQLRVLERLQRLFDELEDYRQYRQGKLNRLVTNLGAGRKPPRGVYI